MRESDVRDIFYTLLTKNNLQEALIRTHYTVAVMIMGKLFIESRKDNDNQAWKILTISAHAKSRLCYFLTLTPGSPIEIESTTLAEAVSLYEMWLEVATYYSDNFEILSQLEAEKPENKKIVLDGKKMIENKLEKHRISFALNQVCYFDVEDFKLMNAMFGWIQLAILGKKTYLRYAKEFNQALANLRQYKAELSVSPKNDTIN